MEAIYEDDDSDIGADIALACGEDPRTADPFGQLWMEEWAADIGAEARQATSLAPFRVCRVATARAALRFGECTAADVVADVGCGDGRVLSLAVGDPQFGARSAVGVELDERVCCLARARQARAFPHAAHPPWLLLCADGRVVDWSEWTLLVLFLLPEGLAVLAEKVTSWLRGGSHRRCVCIHFPIESLRPVRVDSSAALYLYTRESAEASPH